ncbi:hypothetical protein EW146_g552 [Bondarzewia mesenterica]|uniref:Uncharacterized protein n=1 Tax=Bondarzewia mesenterica TaxID=1095465 RepID=A0A4S4M8S6_9AGAM|nr:hypothetical protein EW146_g552 [Bondarzewia mesenterica]
MPCGRGTFQTQLSSNCCQFQKPSTKLVVNSLLILFDMSVTTAAAAVLPPSSPFAAMLRRSKFASYDPRISQVYTTYGGYAHRGDWGVKRPLAIRKRDKYITLQSIDSREQQTEWKTGEPESRWMKRWAELGIEAHPRGGWEHQLGKSARKQWLVDPEFSLGTSDGSVLKSKQLENADEADDFSEFNRKAVPSIMAMKPKEFERYLDKLREQRPVFQKYLQKQVDSGSKKRIASNIVDQAQYESALLAREKFLWYSAKESYHSPSSRAIEQQPHHTAGLSYALASPLTNFFLAKPQVGRRVRLPSDDDEVRPSKETLDRVSVAGMLSKLTTPWAGKSETKSLRITAAKLLNAPRAVDGNRLGLDGVRLETLSGDVSQLDMVRPNPHKPGSRKYIGSLVDMPVTQRYSDVASMTKSHVFEAKNVEPQSQATLELLSQIMRPREPKKQGEPENP